MKDGQHGFDYDEFLELCEFLIDNIYFRYGDNVFKQIVGIPTGTNCAPLLAHLYLFHHELNCLHRLASSNYYHGKLLASHLHL